MSLNISDPLPKKSDIPSKKVRNKSGDLDETKSHWPVLMTRLSKKILLKW